MLGSLISKRYRVEQGGDVVKAFATEREAARFAKRRAGAGRSASVIDGRDGREIVTFH